jgi:hypothetical protein
VADLKSVLTEQLWADFEATCAETGMGETTLSVHDASIIANRVNRGPKPYTVDRSCLRNVLMKGLGDTLQWNKSFIRYETNGDEVTAYFEDGSAEKGALLVGVDGWRSAVRKQSLPNYKLVDTEACTIFGKTFITPELESRFPASAMKWMTLCRDMPPCIQEILRPSAHHRRPRGSPLPGQGQPAMTSRRTTFIGSFLFLRSSWLRRARPSPDSSRRRQETSRSW